MEQLIVKMVVDSWNTTLSRTDALFGSLTDEQLMNEVAPGRNTGIYLLGHLIAVHDRMLPLLGLGTQQYPQLDDVFLTNPDKSGKQMPTIPELRTYWTETNHKLAAAIAGLQHGDWLNRHTSVSEEDFAKEPHRNRLNVLLSRTTHMAAHYGQLLFLKSK